MKADFRYAYIALFSAALAFNTTGCKSNANNADNSQNQAQDASATQPGDPANANVVPVSNATSAAPAQQAGAPAPQSGAPDYTDTGSEAAPTEQSVDQQYPPSQYNADNGYGQQAETYAPQPPPELPDYQQPQCPGDGYIWTPGYWNYASSGYFWVPGAWVMSPYVGAGALWTPSYWGWAGNRYAYYPGYWGRHVGYYGGVNYGFGYVGSGYQGGYWNGSQFAYNRTVNNINTTVVRNVYNYNITNVNTTRVSYNGGAGGIQYRPRPAELVAIHEQHNPPMAEQVKLVQTAKADPHSFARANNGKPATVVVSHPVAADRNVRPPAAVHYAAVKPEQQARPQPAAAAQQRPVANQEARPENRPVQQPARPAEAARPAQQTRPEAQRTEQKPAPRPEQQQRPEQKPAQRPEQQQRPEAKPSPKPAPRPAPAHPAPERKPEQAPRPEEQRPEDRPK